MTLAERLEAIAKECDTGNECALSHKWIAKAIREAVAASPEALNVEEGEAIGYISEIEIGQIKRGLLSVVDCFRTLPPDPGFQPVYLSPSLSTSGERGIVPESADRVWLAFGNQDEKSGLCQIRFWTTDPERADQFMKSTGIPCTEYVVLDDKNCAGPPKPSPATGLVEALEKVRDITKRNLGHQTEKLYDIVPIIDAALSSFKAGDGERSLRELEAVADFVEPHWRGAGVRPTAKWVIDEFLAALAAKAPAPSKPRPVSQEEGQADVTTPTRPNWPEVYRDCAGPLEGEKAGDLVSVTRESARLAEGALRFYRSEIAAYHTHMAAEAEISEVLK